MAHPISVFCEVEPEVIDVLQPLDLDGHDCSALHLKSHTCKGNCKLDLAKLAGGPKSILLK